MSTRFSTLFILAFLLPFLYLNGQTQKLILTREQNSNWLDSLKTLKIDQQLITIKDRLLRDTNIFVRQFYNDRIKVTDSLGNRVYGLGKPTLIISGYSMIIDNKTETSKIITLTNLLTNEFIKGISILSPNNPATTAIYGSSGMNGIIIMTLTKKKYLNKFRKLKLQSNGYRYT